MICVLLLGVPFGLLCLAAGANMVWPTLSKDHYDYMLEENDRRSSK